MSAIPEFHCRRAAVISDIHSNYHALSACYEDAIRRGTDLFIFLGDYVSDLAEPVKTLELVYEIRSKYPTVCLRGNRERYMLEYRDGKAVFLRGSKSGSLLYTYRQLRDQDFDFFASLPTYDQVKINGVIFELAHAFRDNDRCYFEPDDARIMEIFSSMEHSYLLTGHTHRQYLRQHQKKTIINPGSAGIPMGGAHGAQYALLDITNGVVSCNLCSAAYDLRPVISAQFQSGLMNDAPYWAISILHDVISGEECTMGLLSRVSQAGNVNCEADWHHAALAMGMKLTECELIGMINNHETAYFAGGCFWCITPTFKEMDGVMNVVSGYSGGEEINPTYAAVKAQKTRHRETIQIDFDPAKVRFEELLEIFLSSVDPFDPDGQFIDRGHSYTLAVYYCSASQQQAAEAAVRALTEASGRTVHVSIEPFTVFYKAEEGHQDYYLKHPAEFRQELIDSGRIKA